MDAKKLLRLGLQQVIADKKMKLEILKAKKERVLNVSKKMDKKIDEVKTEKRMSELNIDLNNH